jgi:hypothetical protein
MAVLHLELAKALKVLQRLQRRYGGVVQSVELADDQRQRLADAGFLRPVIKGWYVCSNPADAPGDSTGWYGAYWTFLARYLGARFGKRYVLSVPESILLHTCSTLVPAQVVVLAATGGSSALQLPHGTSLLTYQDAPNLPRHRVVVRGLQVRPLADALCRAEPAFFRSRPREAEIALHLQRDVADLLSILLAGAGMPTAAGRLAGAMRFVGRVADAERIVQTMQLAGHSVSESNPFAVATPTLPRRSTHSPYVLRLQSLWAGWRQTVVAALPTPPGIPTDPQKYLRQVADHYALDAYNSLSIEGYQVSDALIRRVGAGNWNPDVSQEDRQSRDALAARGYFQAFAAVQQSLARILAGESPAQVVDGDHHRWHRELFAPAVTAGLLRPEQLAGYRNGPVFIRNSLHTPPPPTALLDCMEALFNLLQAEPHAGVRAVLGHMLFAFVHPYFDGNGRVARFAMNAMLASGGYPWTVIRTARRTEYMAALEAASAGGDIQPFARFVAEEMAAGGATGSGDLEVHDRLTWKPSTHQS